MIRQTFVSLFILGFLINSSLSQQIRDQESIRSIVIVTRHGDRNVIATYPNDPNTEYFEREGKGEMRNEGCDRLFKAGRNLATNLLPVLGKRKTISLKAAANPYPLVIKSLECFMAGINGPQKSLSGLKDPQIESKDPQDTDLILNFGRVNCPALKNASANSEELKILRANNTELIAKISNITGENYDDWDIVKFIIFRTEPIVDEDSMGLERATGVDDEVVKQCKAIGDKEFEITGQIPFQRNMSSFFIKELVKRLNEVKDSNELTFFGYGSVSTSMVPLMITLDMWEGKRPTYGETMIFILRKDGKFEQHFYDIDLKLTQSKPIGCKDIETCTLKDFEKEIERQQYSDSVEEICTIK